MIAVEGAHIDWLLFRQSLALSLVTGRGVEIRDGGSFLESHPAYHPLMRDFMEIAERNSWGALSLTGGTITFSPGRIEYGNYELETNPYSSASECVLLLLPSLISLSFRTSVRVSGVTHSSTSYPVNFINETLFSLLECIGIYSSISLKRFGFYGSGGGGIESRVYPLERIDGASIDAMLYPEKVPEIVGGRIYISGMRMDIANHERKLLSVGLGIADERISIIEVRDSDGMGNVMQVLLQLDTLPVVFSRVLDPYNYAGDFTFQDRDINGEVDDFLHEVVVFLRDGSLPGCLLRELVPFLWIAGIDVYAYENYHESLKDTIALTERFLGDFRL